MRGGGEHSFTVGETPSAFLSRAFQLRLFGGSFTQSFTSE